MSKKRQQGRNLEVKRILEVVKTTLSDEKSKLVPNRSQQS